MSEEKNPFEGSGSAEAIETVKKSKQDLLLEQAEKNAAEDLRKRKEGSVSKSSETKKTRAASTKPKKEAKPKAPKEKKAAKPKAEKKAKAPRAKKEKKPSTSNRAPRQALTDKELAEPRETIRIRPGIIKRVDKFAKLWEMDTNEAAEKMLMTAVGRLNALSRYNDAS